MEKNKADFEKMKMSELLDIYPTLNDNESLDFMEVCYSRFPFDVMEDETNEKNKQIADLQKRLKDVEKTLDIQTRILDRIDKLTKAIKRKK